MSVVIKVENVSKQYRLGKVSTGTLAHDVKRWWHTVRGKEDPYLTIGEVNDRTVKGNSDLVWALRDINFEVKQGEVLGVIGRNGAGKSTLLKILSRTTAPTYGSVKIKGRIASLLEVGTGFHPELTGRENIFLNGAILGMRKKEIQSKFDEIVDFSGVEKYIDTPVKRYSSGMYVRLAFAVAAHLEPEILIVDEVLAVGDAEFQRKCIGKMKDVSGQGRTVLFVSHNMAAVKSLCTSGMILRNGQLDFAGNTNAIIDNYLDSTQGESVTNARIFWNGDDAPGGPEVRLRSIRLLNEKEEAASTFYTSAAIKIEVGYEVLHELQGSRLVMQLIDKNGTIAFSSTNHSVDQEKKEKGTYLSTCIIPGNLLNKGTYQVQIHMGIPGVKVLIPGKPFVSFNTLSMGAHGSTYDENWSGVLAPKLEWSTKAIRD